MLSVTSAVEVVPEARDERLELRDARQLLAAQRADGLPGVGEAVPDELAGAVDRGAQLCAASLALGELPRALQLDRRAGERMREHVVQLARDPAALRDRRRPRLLLARVLELGEQQLGPVLARARLLQEVGDEPEQGGEQRGGENRRRRAPRSAPRRRPRATAIAAPSATPSRQRQPARPPSTRPRPPQARSRRSAAARASATPAAPIAAMTAA